MEFRTKIPIAPKEPKIGYDSKILLLGSCFVENIGEKLEYHKFQTLQNPFGILFHPAAILGFLEKVKSQHLFTEEDIFHHNERWHSFDAHSTLSHPEKEKVLEQLNSAVKATHQFLGSATHVVITPGTAWGYQLVENGKTVANCHKLPQKNFTKELMNVREDLAACLDIISSLNPKGTVIFTVSPVRHLKDGFIENQQSKAALITAVHELINAQNPSEKTESYFPSYELMMDELRDYRFYSEDMVHPNNVAIEYIWQRFLDTWLSSATMEVLEKVGNIQKGLSHRPFNKNSGAHQKFRSKLQQQIEDLQESFPEIRF